MFSNFFLYIILLIWNDYPGDSWDNRKLFGIIPCGTYVNCEWVSCLHFPPWPLVSDLFSRKPFLTLTFRVLIIWKVLQLYSIRDSCFSIVRCHHSLRLTIILHCWLVQSLQDHIRKHDPVKRRNFGRRHSVNLRRTELGVLVLLQKVSLTSVPRTRAKQRDVMRSGAHETTTLRAHWEGRPMRQFPTTIDHDVIDAARTV